MAKVRRSCWTQPGSHHDKAAGDTYVGSPAAGHGLLGAQDPLHGRQLQLVHLHVSERLDHVAQAENLLAASGSGQPGRKENTSASEGQAEKKLKRRGCFIEPMPLVFFARIWGKPLHLCNGIGNRVRTQVHESGGSSSSWKQKLSSHSGRDLQKRRLFLQELVAPSTCLLAYNQPRRAAGRPQWPPVREVTLVFYVAPSTYRVLLKRDKARGQFLVPTGLTI